MFFRNCLMVGQNVVNRSRANTFALPNFRYFSSEDPRNKYIPSGLMDNLPMKPNFILRFKNIISSAVISGIFDPDFSQQNFLEGSKQAVEFVSNCLANEDFNTLEESNCVTPECLTKLKHKLLNFTKPQKERLAVLKEDIWYHYIYQIQVILDDDRPPDPTDRKRKVEIVYIAHHIKENGPGPELLLYKFIRNYTKGVEDSWTINGINLGRVERRKKQEKRALKRRW